MYIRQEEILKREVGLYSVYEQWQWNMMAIKEMYFKDFSS